MVSDVRERVRDFRITFALYVKNNNNNKLDNNEDLHWLSVLVCYTKRVYKASQYVQPCLLKTSYVHILYHKELAYARILLGILVM